MEVHSGLAPRALKRAMVQLRTDAPEENDNVTRLYKYLDQSRPTMAEIKEVVCSFYSVERSDIEGPSRIAPIVFARHVFCYLARKYNRASLNVIKLRVGYLDHSTVHHAVHRIEGYVITRQLVRDDVDLIRLRICEKVLRRSSQGSA